MLTEISLEKKLSSKWGVITSSIVVPTLARSF
jgi:hypothetical protein